MNIKTFVKRYPTVYDHGIKCSDESNSGISIVLGEDGASCESICGDKFCDALQQVDEESMQMLDDVSVQNINFCSHIVIKSSCGLIYTLWSLFLAVFTIIWSFVASAPSSLKDACGNSAWPAPRAKLYELIDSTGHVLCVVMNCSVYIGSTVLDMWRLSQAGASAFASNPPFQWP